MNTYYLSWTYIGNYSDKPIRIEAESPVQAVDKLCSCYGLEFAVKATITVYDRPPVFTKTRA